jgi:hypothetical protein
MAGEYTFWLVDVLAHDGSSEITLRYSDIGYTTKPGDTPANTTFEPRLNDPGSLSRSTFASGTTKGSVEVGYGRVILENADGALAALRGYGWGRQIRIWSITTRLDPNKVAFTNAVRQFTGIVSHVEADYDRIFLVIRDELGLLDVPLQDARFDGTSTGATGIEGNENVEGLVKPMAFGANLRNIALPLVNNSKEARGWNFDRSGAVKPTDALTALRNAGATYTLSGTDHADLATLFAATVTAGQADTCIAESLLRTSGSVTGEITADVTIAPEVTNLLQYSEDFSNAAWTKSSASITANAATAPDGIGGADKLVEAAATADHMTYQAVSFVSGNQYTFSLYAKAAERSAVSLLLSSAAFGSGQQVTFDLANETATVDGGAPTHAITEIGGGWYRVSITATATSTVAANAVAYLFNGTRSYTGDGASGAYLWGAMLNTGALKPYLPTAVNRLTYSEQFDNAAWSKDVGITVTANSTVAPDGTTTADTVEQTTTGTDVEIEQSVTVTPGTSNRITFSVYLKQGTAAYTSLYTFFSDSSTKGSYLILTWSTLALSVGAADGGGVVPYDYGIKEVGDGWYRLWMEVDDANDGANTSVKARFYPAARQAFTGTVYMWGAQINEGALRPYVKTEAVLNPPKRVEATAARVAEAILAEHGYSIEPDSLLALDRKNPAMVGAYFDEEITVLQAAQQVLESIGGYLIAAASGTYRVGRFEAPSGTVRKAITEDITLDGDGSALTLLPTDDNGTGIPSYRLTVAYDRNWTEQDADALAGSVSQDNRVLFGKPSLEVFAEDTSIQTKHPEAREAFIDTLLNDEADASAEASRRLTFEKSEKTRFRVPLPAEQARYDSDDSTPLDIGDRVTLVTDRFGFSSATDFVVIGVDQLFGDGTVTLDVVNSSEW